MQDYMRMVSGKLPSQVMLTLVRQVGPFRPHVQLWQESSDKEEEQRRMVEMIARKQWTDQA
ncbi:hypothetical protein HaLaN_30988, partial [Haematococcus lacustris]